MPRPGSRPSSPAVSGLARSLDVEAKQGGRVKPPAGPGTDAKEKGLSHTAKRGFMVKRAKQARHFYVSRKVIP